jgi:molybdopterin synthase catalytic subunit
MHIRVLFFGALRESLACEEQVLELAGPATAGAVLDYYRDHSPPAAPGSSSLWDVVAIAVNQQYAAPDARLADGDEVALLPPVSGGTEHEHGPEERVRLTRAPIDSGRIVDGIKAGADGAVVIFDGIVRNNTRGRDTLFLDYEAYEAMALTQMRTLAEEAVQRFGVREAVLVHRLGRIEIGESSVLIVVASAHRGAAFDACRWLIDTLKKTVPIWKKEHFVDGAVWADGEPFPPQIIATPAESQA